MPSYKKTAEYDKMLRQLSKIMIFLNLSMALAAAYILIALHYKLPHWTIVLAVTTTILILLISALVAMRNSKKLNDL